MKVVRTLPIEGEKRQHFPCIISWKCPKCGHECEEDYSETLYLSYPTIPGEATEYFYCSKCDHEKMVKLYVDFILKIL